MFDDLLFGNFLLGCFLFGTGRTGGSGEELDCFQTKDLGLQNSYWADCWVFLLRVLYDKSSSSGGLVRLDDRGQTQHGFLELCPQRIVWFHFPRVAQNKSYRWWLRCRLSGAVF